MSRFDAVQAAAKARSTNTLNTDSLARQIVAASEGDARMAYDFLDTLNRHVTDMLQGRK
jgi:replication-associated recombination protein RarA